MGQMGKCVCGQRIDLGNISATGTVTCPGCGRVLKVRKHPEPAPQSNRMCPWCRQSVPAEATVCGNCGLDFSTGLRTAGASKTNHFLVRTLFSFRKNFLTARQLILLAVGCVVVISPFFFLRSRPPVEIYEILPAETFIALNNIDAYPPVHKPKGPRGKEVRIGFVSSGMKLPDALKVFNEPGTDLPKNLYLFRKADDGE